MFPFLLLIFIPIIRNMVPVMQTGRTIDDRHRTSLKWFFFLLFCLMTFRHFSVGTDTASYINTFSRMQNVSWNTVFHVSKEKGYWILVKLISLFSSSQQMYLAVISLIILLPIAALYTKNCDDVSLTLLLFVTLSNLIMIFSGIRQSIAISIGIIAYHWTKENKFIPFLLTVALAMTFHISAFILFPMYFVYRAKITRKWLIVVVPAMIAVFVFRSQVFLFFEGLSTTFSDKYGMKTTDTGAYATLILYLMFAFISYLFADESSLDKELVGLRNIMLVTVALQMFASVHHLAMRLNYYYMIFIPVLIPKIIRHSSFTWRKTAYLARYVMVLFFLGYFLYTAAQDGGALDVYPYHFFWEQV